MAVNKRSRWRKLTSSATARQSAGRHCAVWIYSSLTTTCIILTTIAAATQWTQSCQRRRRDTSNNGRQQWPANCTGSGWHTRTALRGWSSSQERLHLLEACRPNHYLSIRGIGGPQQMSSKVNVLSVRCRPMFIIWLQAGGIICRQWALYYCTVMVNWQFPDRSCLQNRITG